MESTTGLSRVRVLGLVERVHREVAVKRSWHGRRRVLGLFRSVLVVLIDGFDPDQSYVVDGTLVECWNFKGQAGMWLGNLKRSGFNIGVIADLSGSLAWVSDPFPGSIHDARAFRRARIDRSLASGLLIAETLAGECSHRVKTQS